MERFQQPRFMEGAHRLTNERPSARMANNHAHRCVRSPAISGGRRQRPRTRRADQAADSEIHNPGIALLNFTKIRDTATARFKLITIPVSVKHKHSQGASYEQGLAAHRSVSYRSLINEQKRKARAFGPDVQRTRVQPLSSSQVTGSGRKRSGPPDHVLVQSSRRMGQSECPALSVPGICASAEYQGYSSRSIWPILSG